MRSFTFDSNYFDLVNSQHMAGAIHANRWGTYMADILRVLRPGGWCQMVEVYYNVQSDNGTLTDSMSPDVAAFCCDAVIG